ncbi:carboxypeptidase-like regulatory domain-containing protein [Edaphobacter modestus]|uniref:Carboxypeptidase family protein n=1 Tax=Edaphobacter modestus TaxID=388466 RepID=A0A4Q7YYX9_9BACT|nr:carboxypeptidase-like regulatory domain-containing protein [Edaphobacter modestus]RZU42395.1 carboxypeptidase family protein [Edaphobacter modestus]
MLDSTGAAVPHATIVAKNRETGFTSTAESSGAGSYRFPTVPLGSYDISVKMQGFKAANYSGVSVQVNTVSTLDITLEIGSSSEQVTVEASAPSVQSESSELGGVVTTKQVIELPLALGGVGALRSPAAFVFLQPGTIGPGTQNTSNGIRQIKIGGAQNQGMSILVDGVDQLRSENASFFDEESPSVEAIQEFKLTISNPSAEFGRTTGAVESFATKSGTNAFSRICIRYISQRSFGRKYLLQQWP